MFTIIGILFLIAAFAVIALFYHIATQTMWHDIMEEEYEERYQRDFERRWQNSEIRLHQQLVIIDETHYKEEENGTIRDHDAHRYA